jgi:hypothetical protein
MAHRTFPLGTVLSITTGRVLAPNYMGGVYDILNYMTRDKLSTSQLPRAKDHCKTYLLKQYPVLDSPEAQFELAKLGEMLESESGQQEPEKLFAGWLVTFSAKFELPDELEVERVPGDDYEAKDPIQEVEEMIGSDRVIAVQLPKSNDINE